MSLQDGLYLLLGFICWLVIPCISRLISKSTGINPNISNRTWDYLLFTINIALLVWSSSLTLYASAIATNTSNVTAGGSNMNPADFQAIIGAANALRIYAFILAGAVVAQVVRGVIEAIIRGVKEKKQSQTQEESITIRQDSLDAMVKQVKTLRKFKRMVGETLKDIEDKDDNPSP